MGKSRFTSVSLIFGSIILSLLLLETPLCFARGQLHMKDKAHAILITNDVTNEIEQKADLLIENQRKITLIGGNPYMEESLSVALQYIGSRKFVTIYENNKEVRIKIGSKRFPKGVAEYLVDEGLIDKWSVAPTTDDNKILISIVATELRTQKKKSTRLKLKNNGLLGLEVLGDGDRKTLMATVAEINSKSALPLDMEDLSPNGELSHLTSMIKKGEKNYAYAVEQALRDKGFKIASDDHSSD